VARFGAEAKGPGGRTRLSIVGTMAVLRKSDEVLSRFSSSEGVNDVRRPSVC
jgi:hypothetical protein